MTTLTLKLNTVTIPSLYFSIPLILVTLYSFLPIVTHGYSYPPGNDIAWYQQIIDHPFSGSKYYGMLPGALIGITAYYYLTPVAVFIGLHLVLSNYHPLASSLTWILIFLMSSVILQDMEAGTFVGIVGFYGVSIPVLYFTLKSKDFRISIAYIPIAILFHTVAGIIISIGYIATSIITQQAKRLLFVAPFLTAVAVYMALEHSSSTIQIARLIPFIDSPSTTKSMISDVGHYTDPMPLMLFMKNYLGVSLFCLIGFTGLLVYNAMRRGYKPEIDTFILSLVFLSLFLPLFIFTDLQLNSDRIAKFYVGILSILCAISLLSVLSYLKSKYFNILMSGLIVLLLVVPAPALLKYWTTLGKYV